MSKISKLKDKTLDAKVWTPLDILEKLVKDIQEGVIDPAKVEIIVENKKGLISDYSGGTDMEDSLSMKIRSLVYEVMRARDDHY